MLLHGFPWEIIIPMMSQCAATYSFLLLFVAFPSSLSPFSFIWCAKWKINSAHIRLMHHQTIERFFPKIRIHSSYTFICIYHIAHSHIYYWLLSKTITTTKWEKKKWIPNWKCSCKHIKIFTNNENDWNIDTDINIHIPTTNFKSKTVKFGFCFENLNHIDDFVCFNLYTAMKHILKLVFM